jgi:hypothetical protein
MIDAARRVMAERNRPSPSRSDATDGKAGAAYVMAGV